MCRHYRPPYRDARTVRKIGTFLTVAALLAVGLLTSSQATLGRSTTENGRVLAFRSDLAPAVGTYPVTFQEVGLPSGTEWNVTLAGVNHSSLSNSTTFYEPNGTYSYSIGSEYGWRPTGSPSTGTVRVSGLPNAILVSGFPVGSGPSGIAYDPANNRLYIADFDSNNITVVNATTDQPVGPGIPEPYGPIAIFFDPDNGDLYAANWGGGNVTIIDAATGDQVGTGLSVGAGPDAFAYDPDNGRIYVAASQSGSLQVIYASNNTLGPSFGVGSEPESIAFDPVNGQLFVANFNSENVAVVNTSTDQVYDVSQGSSPGGSQATGAAYDPFDGDVYISNIEYQGCIINATTDQIVGTLGYNERGWSVMVDPATGNVYVPSWSVVDVINWTTGLDSSYIPVGNDSQWQGRGVTPMIYDPTNGELVVANPASANVTVINGYGAVETAWEKLPTRPIQFTEVGLPSNSQWWVNLTGGPSQSSASTQLSFSAPPGTYDYSVAAASQGYSVHPSSGVLPATGAVNLSLNFSQQTYPVSFSESGLPATTEWWVNVSGETPATSTQSALVANVGNGTHHYAVATSDKSYRSSGGSVTVNGTGKSASVTFQLEKFTSLFLEDGLPTGTTWTVTVGGSTWSSTNSTVSVNLPNGTYQYEAGSASGYSPTSATGSLVVSGPPSGSGTLVLYYQPSSSTGAVPWLLVGIGLVAALVAVVAIALVLRSRGKHRARKAPPRT
jgi:YVTN family beta-propeller protein